MNKVSEPTAGPQPTPEITSAVQSQAQPQARRQEITPEQREFMGILNDLIMSAQELSYALAVIDHDKVEGIQELKELVDTAKQVVRNVWRFHKFVKTRMRVSVK